MTEEKDWKLRFSLIAPLLCREYSEIQREAKKLIRSRYSQAAINSSIQFKSKFVLK